MYTKYSYNAGATKENIFSDLKALFTGETNKANLSASCNQATTDIVSNTAAGWTFDAPQETIYAPELITNNPSQISALNYASLHSPVYAEGLYVIVPTTGPTAYYSADLISWTSSVMPSSPTFHPPLVFSSGGVMKILVVPSTATTNVYVGTVSAGSITWTTVALGVASATYRAPVLSADLTTINLVNSASASTIVRSTNGSSWSAITLPGAAAVWTDLKIEEANLILTNASADTRFLASSDWGATWTDITLPASMTVKFVKFNGSHWVVFPTTAIDLAKNASTDITVGAYTAVTNPFSSYTVTAVYWFNSAWIVQTGSTAAFVYRSTDSITWFQITLPDSIIAGFPLVKVTSFLLGKTGAGLVVRSSDGLNWELPGTGTLTNATASTIALIDDTLFSLESSSDVIIYTKDGKSHNSAVTSFTAGTLAAGKLVKINNRLIAPLIGVGGAVHGGFMELEYSNALSHSGTFSSNYATGGTGKKRMALTVTTEYLNLNFGSSYQNGVLLDCPSIYNQVAYLPQLDLVNGGVLYISCSARHLAIYSYLGATATWGSSTGNGFILMAEITREDAWNVDPYPSFILTASTLLAGSNYLYLPKAKVAPSSDKAGTDSRLIASYVGVFNKRPIASDGTSLAHIVSDIKASLTSGTYLILGGTVLGGIKRTTDSFGATLDEVTVNGITHVIWGISTNRYLFPKA